MSRKHQIGGGDNAVAHDSPGPPIGLSAGPDGSDSGPGVSDGGAGGDGGDEEYGGDALLVPGAGAAAGSPIPDDPAVTATMLIKPQSLHNTWWMTFEREENATILLLHLCRILFLLTDRQ